MSFSSMIEGTDTRSRLVEQVRQALVEEDAVGDPDDLDRLSNGVVDALLSVDDDGRCGWLLRGDTEEVHAVTEIDGGLGSLTVYTQEPGL